MDKDNRALPLRIVSAVWRGLDRLRRLLHLILLLGLFLVLFAAAVGERVLIPQTAALVIAPRGVLVDHRRAFFAAHVGCDQLALDRGSGEPLVPERDRQFGDP